MTREVNANLWSVLKGNICSAVAEICQKIVVSRTGCNKLKKYLFDKSSMNSNTNFLA